MGIRKDRQALRDRSGHLIAQARIANGTSQARLAELLGVSQPLVSSWECGKVTASLDDLCEIEFVIGMPQGALVNAIAYPIQI